MRRLVSLGVPLLLMQAALAAPRRKEFEAHKKKAQVHYELAEYSQAIEEYKAAYAISQESWILYNIAQAYRLSHDCALAARFYKNYVAAVRKGKDPAPERTRHAREQLPLMEKCAAETRPPPAGESAPPPTAPAPAQAASASAPDSGPGGAIPTTSEPTPEPDAVDATAGRWKKIAGLSLLGGGAVAVGLGVYFNVRLLGKEHDLEDRFSSIDPMFWTPEAQALEDDMKRQKTRAQIAYGIGGALLAGGAVLSYLGFTESAPEAVALTPLPGGAAVHATLRF